MSRYHNILGQLGEDGMTADYKGLRHPLRA
jgi:hypothetical protein